VTGIPELDFIEKIGFRSKKATQDFINIYDQTASELLLFIPKMVVLNELSIGLDFGTSSLSVFGYDVKDETVFPIPFLQPHKEPVYSLSNIAFDSDMNLFFHQYDEVPLIYNESILFARDLRRYCESFDMPPKILKSLFGFIRTSLLSFFNINENINFAFPTAMSYPLISFLDSPCRISLLLEECLFYPNRLVPDGVCSLAAISHLSNLELSIPSSEGTMVAVLDMGGGFLDISVSVLTPISNEVKFLFSTNEVNGRELDFDILSHFQTSFPELRSNYQGLKNRHPINGANIEEIQGNLMEIIERGKMFGENQFQEMKDVDEGDINFNIPFFDQTKIQSPTKRKNRGLNESRTFGFDIQDVVGQVVIQLVNDVEFKLEGENSFDDPILELSNSHQDPRSDLVEIDQCPLSCHQFNSIVSRSYSSLVSVLKGVHQYILSNLQREIDLIWIIGGGFKFPLFTQAVFDEFQNSIIKTNKLG